MPAYQPTSRRPIAGLFRRTPQGAVRFCVRWHVHPDAISYLSIVASAAAGLCFWQTDARPWLLLAGPVFCSLRLWLNMLDGMVALASGQASLRGEILNDLPDRISDGGGAQWPRRPAEGPLGGHPGAPDRVRRSNASPRNV
jgi:hypothetical protein